jgi:branched-chain amino acid transport system permease protein
MGAGVAAIAGGLYSHYMSFIAPEHFGVWASILMIMYIILGGTSNMWGPVLGAVIMTLLPEYIRFLAEWRITVFGLLILVMLLFRPEGLLARRTLTVKWKSAAYSINKAGEAGDGSSSTKIDH